MSLIHKIAKSIFIRRRQTEEPPLGTDINSFHMYEPGVDWHLDHYEWSNLSDDDKAKWISDAEQWLSVIQETSPMTYSWLLENFKDDEINESNLERI